MGRFAIGKFEKLLCMWHGHLAHACGAKRSEFHEPPMRRMQGRDAHATVLVCCALLFAAGCSSPGELVVHQDSDGPLRMTKVTVAGDYGLFRPGEQQPLLEFPCKVGDQIGFEKVNDGVVIWLYGVSGNIRNRLEIDKSYEWRRIQ